ncbi:MAG TPA: cytosine permease [Nocardioidaceae bacterium]|nr:cytosine permease [Nocardioidaceae bacterium]
MTSTELPSRTRPVVEVRSIDYVPPSERHGKVWHQGPFWFTGNFVLATMVTGFIGPSLGLAVGWSVLAVTLGASFGTLFMCFHANQGPTMGLPQMIQSRAQWGVRGAIFPFIAVVFVYIGFNVFDVILAAEGFDTVLKAPDAVWYIILVAVSVLIAVVGYDLLMLVQRWLSYVLMLVFAIITIKAVTSLDMGSQIAHGGSFSGASFLIVFAAAAGYQISYAVYVSDYSRYLPEDSSAVGVIAWTYLGAAGSAIWLMSLGAVLGSALPSSDVVTTVRQVGDSLVSGFGTFAVIVSAIALVTIMSVNAYGAMLTSASGVDAFKKVNPTVRLRVVGIVVISAIAFIVALSIPTNYLGSFNNFVILMLYFLVPWTAVNLVDFYFVRHGHYAILEIFNPSGIYHRWAWRGLVAYFAGLVCMIPFVALTFFEGPVTKLLGGADVSFAVGLAVAGYLYYLFSRNLDLSAERVAVQQSRAALVDTTA